MIRRRPYLLPTLGVALLVGGLVGVQLGESAIAGINPIHFQGEAEPPAGVQVNAAPANAPPTYLDAYGWEEGQSARASDCGDCARPGETYALVRTEQPLRMAGPNWRDETGAAELDPGPPGEVRARRGDREVARYADFPIEAKPESAPRAEAPADKADAHEDADEGDYDE